MNVYRLSGALLIAVLLVGLFAGLMPAEAQDNCTNGITVWTNAETNMVSAPSDGQEIAKLGAGQEVLYADMAPESGMIEVCFSDLVGWVPVSNITDVEPLQVQQTPVPQPANAGSENDDGDSTVCEHDECSVDVGVNEYPEDSLTDQIGYAFGESVSWDGNLNEGEGVAFVTLMPGWYLDLTVSRGGGVRVYNIPRSWTAEQRNALAASVAGEVFPAGSNVEYLEWDSEVESLSGSAAGGPGVGPGDNYPQLDGQEFSCYPQAGACVRTVTVASERQIALVFGTQIGYMGLEGPHSDDVEESIRDVQYRCDMVVLAQGSYTGLVMRDARVEVYNVPEFDQSGWFRNLIAERVAEQAGHYGCPQHTSVPIWNADGTSVEEYFLRWDGDNARVGGPRVIQVQTQG